MLNNTIQRGQIYYIDLSSTKGSEQGGMRPCVIIQNNKGNQHAPTTIVVPLTTQWKKKLPMHALVRESARLSLALCEQIRTVDKSRISGECVGECSPHTMEQIDLALKISLGL